MDGYGEPVPVGVAGELYIGGAGVARGYLNRPELTAERFIASPFVDGDRLYRTGDLGRYLPGGDIEFLGRNDFQVKIRGFRIELGEIEARLAEHPAVREAVVLAREDVAGDKRLVAYYLPGAEEPPVETLRAHLAAQLPDYMVPAAYVRLDTLPLTPNGKLDRAALPAPDGEAYAQKRYEAPQGPVEAMLAAIWAEILGLDRVGRHDNFFELGGHSLLAVRLLERIRQAGLQTDVRSLFNTPTLKDLATSLQAVGRTQVEVPPNRIPADCTAITPDMLSLVTLDQAQIERIAAATPGGVANIQDIYPLAPLQEGILFHHLMEETGDTYLLRMLLSFPDRTTLERYVAAKNAVIARHDILRTAVVWRDLPDPVQVVWRHARLDIEEVTLDPGQGDIAGQLRDRFDPRHYRIDIGQAPLTRLIAAWDEPHQQWVVVELAHHLAYDHTALEVIHSEIAAYLTGELDSLPPAMPFRTFVAQTRLGTSPEAHETFFRTMLGDVEESTAPFGLLDVRGDGTGIAENRILLDASLSRRLRTRARTLGVSAASLFHVAWGQVMARTSGRTDPVFGTVLFGRMQGGEGADRVLGLFINTLPVRLTLGDTGAETCVRQTHRLLAELLDHEHAPLALAQRCSALPAQAPLFTALLNYRYSQTPEAPDAEDAMALEILPGVRVLAGEERTNYPLSLSVDDLGQDFALTAQVTGGVDPARVCAMTLRAVQTLIDALEADPGRAVGRLDVLSAEERRLVLEDWNATAKPYPQDRCVHQLFEDQAAAQPDAVALVHEAVELSYGELNARANRLAQHLRTRGVVPDDRVAICVERSPEMVVGLLAILKAGGAYVPLDPSYPAERLAFMLADCAPRVVLTHAPARAALDAALAGHATAPVLDLVADTSLWDGNSDVNPDPDATGLTSRHLAYVIYTSGSTGAPKGVLVEHRGVVNGWFQLAYAWFAFGPRRQPGSLLQFVAGVSIRRHGVGESGAALLYARALG